MRRERGADSLFHQSGTIEGKGGWSETKEDFRPSPQNNRETEGGREPRLDRKKEKVSPPPPTFFSHDAKMTVLGQPSA